MATAAVTSNHIRIKIDPCRWVCRRHASHIIPPSSTSSVIPLKRTLCARFPLRTEFRLRAGNWAGTEHCTRLRWSVFSFFSCFWFFPAALRYHTLLRDRNNIVMLLRGTYTMSAGRGVARISRKQARHSRSVLAVRQHRRNRQTQAPRHKQCSN